MQIKGKKAVVIAGAQGIGLAYCKALLRNGAKVFMGDIQEEKGKQVVQEFRTEFGTETAFFCKVDVTNVDDIKEIFSQAKDKFGQIDIVVGNAGILDEFNWELCLNINLMGTIRVTQEAFKHMAKDSGGSGGVLIHTASISGLRPEHWAPVYSATKHGVVGYCRSFAHEKQFSKHGIRINCICPTAVKTALQDQINRTYFPEELAEHLKTIDNIEMSELEDALILLIEDESYNGAALRITKAFGKDVATFQDHPPQ